MADLKRWFKVWTTILEDPHFQELSLEDIGRWVLLGAMTASVGVAGQLDVPGTGRRVCEALRLPDLEAVKKLLERLPSIILEEGKKRHGDFAVTWSNWHKFQVDSTMAERAQASRSKRRGEEKRGEGKATTRVGIATRAILADDEFIAILKKNSAYQGLNFDRELGKFQAWFLTPRGRGKKPTRGRLVAWLNRALEDLPFAPHEDNPYRDWPRS